MIEILVALAILSLIAGSFVSLFASTLRLKSLAETRLETHQALGATMDALSRDIRLAGVCFVSNGQFVSLAGADNATQDSLTIRSGLTSNMTCAPKALTADAQQGDNTLSLDSADGFQVNTAGYVTNGSAGDFFTVTAVSGNSLTTNGSWARTYAPGSSAVYLMEERVYTLCPGNVACPDNDSGPALVLARDRGPAHVFADGITAMDVQYRLADDTLVSLPPDDATWRLVKEVLVSVTARSLGTLPGGGFYEESGNLTVKPRNLQP